MADKNIDTVLLSVGHDLPYLTGYTAMPLERLTMLALHSTGVPLLFVPRLEAPRVEEMPGVFELVPWMKLLSRLISSHKTALAARPSRLVTRHGPGSSLA